MTTPDGATTRYGCDAAGRLTWVEHPLLGRAAFDRDASGRLVAASADGVLQSWEHRDGFVVAHTVTDEDGAQRTEIGRDEGGRIVALDCEGIDGRQRTTYAYDGACQLIEARLRSAAGTSVTGWRYDAAGRLAAEVVDGETTEHVYDLAGQLLASVDADGERVRYGYDGAGRRVRAEGRDGVRELTWSPTGHLAGITDRRGESTRRTVLHADALGELASVDGTEVFWDTAAYAGAPVLVGDTSVVTAGAVTGIGAQWSAPGWRTSRSQGVDPWSVAGAVGTATGLDIGASGELSVGGLEWMGARVFDPASRGFLSVDPLDPTTGAGWAGNPYSYAGNDPLHALDPRGLKPVSDAELAAYRNSNGIGGTINSAWNATKSWMKDNWEYVAGGAMVVAGGVLMATGVGGPVGMMLISAGADTIIQKATTGSVNWGEVGVSFVAGGIGGGFAAAKLGATGLRGAMVAGAVSGGAGGGMMSGYQYATGPGPHSVTGFLGATAQGAGSGAIFGSLGGAAGHGITTYAGRSLSAVTATPAAVVDTTDDLTRVGRWMSGDEHAAMVRTSEVQVGGGGTTHVAHPPSQAAFERQAKPGSHYVEFDVPQSTLRPGGAPGWAQIPSPEHPLYGRLAEKTGIPLQHPVPATNIVVVGSK